MRSNSPVALTVSRDSFSARIIRCLVPLPIRTLGAVAAAAVAFASFGGAALATPPEGAEAVTLGQVAMTTDLGPGTGDVVVQRITLAPGGTSGWHSHPGPAIAVITAGALTLYDGMDASCQGRVYEIGQGFVEPGRGHVHIARNEGTSVVEVAVTYLEVPAGGSPGIDAADPGNCKW